MKSRKFIPVVLIPLVMTLSLFVVFYSSIECKPNHAGFWFVLVMGMSIGVALTRTILWYRETDKK
jgi:hypothetical protein